MSDEEFINNIEKCIFNYDNWTRCKELVEKGLLVYECGYGYGRFVKAKNNHAKINSCGERYE